MQHDDGIDVPKLFRIWHDHTLRRSDLPAILGCTPSAFTAAVKRHGLKRRPPRHKPRADALERQANDPTPAEIAERAAAIRATWGPERFRLTRP
jgi:hypothetical protein